MQMQSTCLELDLLAYAPASMSLADCAATVLKPGIKRQLDAMQSSLQACESMQPHCACHFQPPGWPHCVSLVYPFAKAHAEVRAAEHGLRLCTSASISCMHMACLSRVDMSCI